jgi:hypothetical protein
MGPAARVRATLDDWYEGGDVVAVKRNYRLVLIDARDQGYSEKPHDRELLRARAGCRMVGSGILPVLRL